MNKMQYRPVLYFFGQFKLIYGAIVVLIFVGAALESISVAAFFPVIASVISDSPNDTTGILGFARDVVDALPFSDPVIGASFLLIGACVAKGLTILMRDGLINYGGAKVTYKVKKEVMDRYAGANYQFFLDNKQGDLIFNSTHAPIAVGTLLTLGPQMLALFGKLISLGVLLVLVFPLAALGFAILGITYYICVHFLSIKLSWRYSQNTVQAHSEQTVVVNEFVSGIHQVLIFNAARHWLRRFDRENKKWSDNRAKHLNVMVIPRPVMEVLAISLLLGVVLVLRETASGNVAEIIPTIGVLAVAMAQILPAVTSFGQFRMQFVSAMPTVDLAYRAIKDPVPTPPDGAHTLESFQREISFDHLSFTHKGRLPLINDISVTFPRGEATAIVGASGSGKSTFINLILGIFQPTEGKITVDGIPLSDIKIESWLDKIGTVSQDTFIYHSTIEENIRFGREEYSRELVVQAAEIANAHGFITEFPEGYDTIVGDQGMKLSGGQQQRLAIARAMLSSPEILILDEATSSLDSISEKQVQEAIDNVAQNRTVIIVAHRLSTVMNADNIIVLDDGAVVEQGTHEELLDQKGKYALQMAAFER